MESILKSDIFFFITSICTILITIVFLIAGFYFIRMTINLYKISATLRKVSENTEGELKEIGEQIRNSKLFNFIFGNKKESKNKKV